MKRTLLVVFLLVAFGAGTAWAGGCEGCEGVKVAGYMAPNLRMIDKGEDNKADIGFGMAFNRFLFMGEMGAGEIVKSVAWRVETDISQTGVHGLQWAFVQPKFNDQFSFRIGHIKKAFSREVLHSTAKLLTVDRHPTTTNLGALEYVGFNYGLELMLAQEMFKATVGVYEGTGGTKWVGMQDPALDFGLRAIAMPVEGLEIGANLIMKTLPIGGSNLGTYVDTLYEANSGMAYGLDAEYKKAFDEKMSLWAQAEFGMGDNWMGGAKEPAAEDTWEDFEWYSFMYFNLKALFMVTPEFGIHLGYSMWDPNTDADAGENDAETMITPGVVYYWAKNLRTQVEVQMHTMQMGVDAMGETLDDCEYTHFVLQQVFSW